MGTGQGREGAPPPAVQRVLRRMIDSGPSLGSWRGSEWAAIRGRAPPMPLDSALKARTRPRRLAPGEACLAVPESPTVSCGTIRC
jgi:hypothetical protein